jgi:hypothetical protein
MVSLSFVCMAQSNDEAHFYVNSDGSLTNPQILIHEDGNDYARLNLKNNNGENYWTIAAYIASNVRNDRLNFWNGTTGDVMSLTGDGQLGINVGISPKTELHVGNGGRVLFGQDTLGNGDKLMFLPDLHAFRVGTVATGAASTYWNRDSIGLYSFASGFNTRAQGYGATAMGRDTEATNSYAHATGYFTNADGQYSTAMGFNTDAFGTGCTALGYSTDAEENYSFAAGYFTEAQAIYATALGHSTQAKSYASTAIGRFNRGLGSPSSWVATDPILEIGIGSSNSNRANAMLIRKDGRVGIGTDFPSELLHVNGVVRIGSFENIVDGGSFLLDFDASLRPMDNGSRNLGNAEKRWNTVYTVNGVNTSSDARLKNNIQNLDYGLEEILGLRSVTYQLNDYPEMGKKIGLIAQEVRDIIPEIVVEEEQVEDEKTGIAEMRKTQYLGIQYDNLVPVLIQAIQDQQDIIDKLEQRIQTLEEK